MQIAEETGQIIDKVAGYIQALAEALKVPAEHVYQVVTQQQVIEGIVNLSVTLIVLGVSLYFFIKSINVLDKTDPRGEDESPLAATFIISGILGLISLLTIFFGFTHYLTQIFNPEYHTLKSIVEMVK